MAFGKKSGTVATGSAALALVAVMAAPGCKNACEKAADYASECLSGYCEQNPDDRVCEALGVREERECDDRATAAAEQLMTLSCDVLSQQLRADSLAVQSYVSRARTTEATLNVRELAIAARSYFESERASPTGALLPYQFPATAPRTPAEVPCGTEAPPRASDWEHPTWEALNFAPRGPHRYSYQFESSGEGAGARFVVSAFGDLDCDGNLSTFRIGGTGQADGSVIIDPEVESVNELE